MFDIVMVGSGEGEQTEKTPSDEGFTELEPTVNGSAEDAEVPSKPHSAAEEDLRDETQGPCQTETADSQEVSNPNPVPTLSQTKKKVDEEEDEGVAQNSSVEEGMESQLSTSETEKQGDVLEKPTSLEVTEAKDVKSKGAEESMKDVSDIIVTSPVDQNRKSSLKEAAEAHGKCSPHERGPAGELQNGLTEEEGLSEEERRRRNYEAEVKSWLMARIQAPIKGKNYLGLPPHSR